MTHEYPRTPTLDSVSISRVSALSDYALTLRQRQFLVTVMVHSGCILERQYCMFTGTARGQNSREFVARNSCSFRREFPSTETALFEPPQPHRPSATCGRLRLGMKVWWTRPGSNR